MIVVDSCVWIDHFATRSTRASEWLDQHFEPANTLLGDVIALEVLRGFRLDKDYRAAKAIFDVLPYDTMLGKARAYRAASRYRDLRKRGLTVRKRGDITIASYCIDTNIPLLTSDRDFAPFAKHLGLALIVPIEV